MRADYVAAAVDRDQAGPRLGYPALPVQPHGNVRVSGSARCAKVRVLDAARRGAGITQLPAPHLCQVLLAERELADLRESSPDVGRSRREERSKVAGLGTLFWCGLRKLG